LKIYRLYFKLIVLLFFVVAQSNLLWGNVQTRMMIEDLSSKADLPEGSINCISQDDHGFIWIGSYRGLYRYDGYQAINFSSINPEFSAFKIKELLVNGDDLWVGTLASGLMRISLVDYSVTHYHKNAVLEKRISDDNVLSLAVINENNILVGTEWGGLNIIGADGQVGRIINKDAKNSSINATMISSILPVGKEKVLLGTNGLVVYDLKKNEAERIFPEVFNRHIYEISELGQNNYLIFSVDGLFLLNLGNGRKDYQKISDERIKTAVKIPNVPNPSFIISLNSELVEFNPLTKAIRKIELEPNDILPQTINTLFYSHDDVVFLGTENGLFTISARKKHFENYAIEGDSKSQNIISNIVTTEKNLFAGSWGNGLYKLNKKTEVLEKVNIPSFPELKSDFIYSMRETNNTIWFSTKENLGIYKFTDNQEPYQLTRYRTFQNENNQPHEYTVTHIYVGKHKNLLIGTWEGLLFYYDETTDNFSLLKDKQGKLPLLRDFSIFSIAEDAEGNYWVGGNGCGVLKMTIEGNQIASQQLFNEKDGLVSNYVTSIFISRNNKVWIGTDAGLTVIDNNKFSKAFHQNIIYNIQSIIEDPIGFLWIGTQKGLLRLNSNNMDESVKLFETTDGLKNRSFYLNSICSDNNNTFYFGGYKGVDYFIPYKIEYNYTKPKPQIVNLYLFNERIFPGNQIPEKQVDKIVTNLSALNLRYNQNTFSLEFANLEYQFPEKCQYSYMLEGVDKNWNYRDASNRIAYYTKLSPGNYTFKVRSSNNDGIWCDEPTVLSITIAPPLWASTWAYIVYFIVAMLLIFSVVYRQINKVQEKHEQQIKELEYKKQKELDELKLRFFTNISHEFRTPLTLILGPITKLLENDKNEALKEKHLMIYRNASRLLQLTNRIMDFRKNENEQLRLRVESTNISEFIYNIFLFFNYEAQKRKIDYRFKTEFDKKILVDQEFIESVTFNLLSNAFKYTPDNRSINVTLKQVNDQLHIYFSDTGRGISAEHLTHIFDRFYSSTKRNSAGIGLSFSKRLMEMHKGDILAESTYNKGSKFTVVLPVNDVYTAEEKAKSDNKEVVLDWKRIDQSILKNASTDLNFLKEQYDKGELLALVVDDNFEMRQFLRSLLAENFKVIEASNGKEGLELAYENIPDIIISDIMMPEMDGLEMCQTLKTDVRTDHIPIILTTVLSAQSDRIEGLSKGADSYIPKPIDPNHLMVRVQKLVEKQMKLKDKFKLSDYTETPSKVEEPSEEVHPLVKRAREIVLKNLDNSEYNIDNFCADLELSRMQLYRKFKAITGLSANSFIRKVRLYKAAEMLKTGKYTVKEVTYDVGFIDLKYFRKCFNDEFGMNPSEYAQIDDEEEANA
jgi:signal transduction histidine kinase/DNA-binding response OmpR family regulator/ligand-binding sensor domain-containing protein